MTREQFSIYMAGVVDSDGSLSIAIRHRKRTAVNYTCMFQLTWSDTVLTRVVFDRLVELYGGSYSICTTSTKNRFINAKPVVKYSLVSKQLEPFVKDVLPFLMLKRRQARNVLRLRATTGYYCGGKPKRLQDFHAALYELNKALNTKNKSGAYYA